MMLNDTTESTTQEERKKEEEVAAVQTKVSCVCVDFCSLSNVTWGAEKRKKEDDDDAKEREFFR